MSLKSVIDAAKHIAFEDAQVEEVKAQPTSKTFTQGTSFPFPAQPLPTLQFPQNGGVVSPATMPKDDGGFYSMLMNATDFDTTDVGALLKKFIDPLMAVPMDDRTRFQAALAQAKQHGNLTPETILAAVDSLKAALQTEQQKFQASADQMNTNEVVARQQTIAEKQAKIVELQNEVAQLSNEMVSQQSVIQRTQQNFSLAVSRRSYEIDQLKAKYAALLG